MYKRPIVTRCGQQIFIEPSADDFISFEAIGKGVRKNDYFWGYLDVVDVMRIMERLRQAVKELEHA